MSFTSKDVVWPLPPDWAPGVRESLAWATEIQQASATGVTYHLCQRLGPLRTFDFEGPSKGQERRVLDMLLSDRGGKPWVLPIFPDQQWIRASISAGATFLPCDTAGYDFVEGGSALLYRAVNDWELVSIDTVEPEGLGLLDELAGNWAPGARLYPVRKARLRSTARLVGITDDVARARIGFTIDELCDWPAVLPSTSYLTHPVLENSRDFGDTSEVQYERLLGESGNGSGLPFVADTAGVPLRTTPHSWQLFGRAEQSAFRSLLYGLRGRQVPIWVPSWDSDLLPIASIGSSATAITVEWAGYTLFGRQQPNRRDIRIELNDGTLFYRRITGSAVVSGNEVLQISSALGQAVAPGAIRRVSFMTLCTLASDEIQLQHSTDSDGHARAIAPWKAVVPDV